MSIGTANLFGKKEKVLEFWCLCALKPEIAFAWFVCARLELISSSLCS